MDVALGYDVCANGLLSLLLDEGGMYSRIGYRLHQKTVVSIA